VTIKVTVMTMTIVIASMMRIGNVHGGTGTLKVDGTVVDSHPMPKSLPIAVSWAEYFNVGLDTGTPVDDNDYQVPFRFTGKLDKLTVKLGQ